VVAITLSSRSAIDYYEIRRRPPAELTDESTPAPTFSSTGREGARTRRIILKKLISFMAVTLDGYHEGPNGEFDWPNVDDEFYEFSISQLNDIDTLVFGRATYEGMASYWPTAAALESDPIVAEKMNTIRKVVVSRTLDAADWQNTTLVKGKAADAISELKQRPGKYLAVFGSSELTANLLEQGLVDELRVMVMPILLGAGNSLFRTLNGRVPLELRQTRTFSSGNVLLVYRPAAR
jgi:dihydrofolate reductase